MVRQALSPPSISSLQLPEWFGGFRPFQQEAVDEILTAFARSSVVILDAPTGSGKTVIAEAVRQDLAVKHALYVCTTKSLQAQVEHDFPYAKVIKGRDNYPTADRADRFTSRFDRLSAADCTKRKGHACPNCPRDHEPDDDELGCSWCHPWYRCPYEAAKSEALRAPLAVANTAYFLTEANGPGKFSDLDLVIVDEADRLEAEVMGHVEVGISRRRLAKYDLGAPRHKTKPESWEEWIHRSAIPGLVRGLGEIRTAARNGDLPAIREEKWLKSTVKALGGVHLTDGSWVYTGYTEGDVRFRPVTVEEWAPRLLWGHAERWLLMSATIISPEEIAASLGIEDYEYVVVPSVFSKTRRPIIVRPVASMAHKETLNTSKMNWDAVTKEIARILESHPDDRILVHAVSYAFTDYLVKALTNPRVVWYKSAKERDQALRRFKETPGAVLIAPSMDRGIDLPHDLCRVVVVAKVPFPDLSDKQISTRLYATKGGDTWYRVQTVRTLVQMMGRGMRAEDDWCVVYLIDRQFVDNVWSRARDLIPKWVAEAIAWDTRTQDKVVAALRQEVS